MVLRGREFGEVQVYMMMRGEGVGGRCVKVYSVRVLGGCAVRLLVRVNEVVGMAGWDLVDREVKVPKLVNVHRLNPKNRELQVEILLKAIKRLP